MQISLVTRQLSLRDCNNTGVPLGLEVVVCAACTMDYYFYVDGWLAAQGVDAQSLL